MALVAVVAPAVVLAVTPVGGIINVSVGVASNGVLVGDTVGNAVCCGGSAVVDGVTAATTGALPDGPAVIADGLGVPASADPSDWKIFSPATM
ncbi:MAG: hypothetical protein HC828_21595 [Blastochloris sp.]|nr:hypothetical protein [Blastochloris sp.]